MENIQIDGRLVKHLGHWTRDHEIEVQGRYGAAVIDLRSGALAGRDIEVRLRLDRAMVKLLVPDGAVLDQAGLQWTGRGRVKDWTGVSKAGGAHIRVTGTARESEIRVHRGGMAVLSALCSRAFVEDCIRSHRNGSMPTVVDPSWVR
jgi:hypothetical protein